MIVSKYQYPSLQRVTINGKRQYTDGSDPVPSVTTVLSETGDKTALVNWRKRVGEAEAQRISNESAGLGTKVHNALEKFILEEDWDTFGSNHVSVMAQRMVNQMIEKGLSQVDEVWGVEVGLIAPGLYAGTSDAIGKFNGVDSVIDFKTAKKIKKREWIEDYFMQGCAYALAHNEMFGSKIQQVAIMMVDREGDYADFVIEGDEFDHYCHKWANRLADYYSLS